MATTTEKPAKAAKTTAVNARLRVQYKDTIAKELQKELGLKNIHQVPQLEKVIVNIGLGKAKDDKKILEVATNTLTKITGQKPVSTSARKSVSNFKVREGMKIGCRVTLRGDRAHHFFDKLCTVALPKLRDFQGLSPKSFDGRGNYSLGLKEQLVFPEIDYDSFDKIRGMDITICTTAQTDAEARFFLKAMGLPLREK